MSKKSSSRRKTQQPKSKAPYHFSAAATPEDVAKRQEVVKRLSAVMKALSSPPEPILMMLSRLGIPWQNARLPFENDEQHDCVVIRVADLAAGEARHQAEGSVYRRIYGQDYPTSPPENEDVVAQQDTVSVTPLEMKDLLERNANANGYPSRQENAQVQPPVTGWANVDPTHRNPDG